MNQQEFHMLDDENLIWIYVELIIRKVRGKAPATKSQIIMQLTNGQRALFLFQVLYGHANNGIPQFFAQISYLADRLDIWSALKSGMKYFNDIEMLSLIEKMETVYAYYEVAQRREDRILLDELEKLYKERIPFTLKRIGSLIRSNPAEFTVSFDLISYEK